MTQNPTQALAGFLLKEPLEKYVANQRKAGAGWDRIASELAVATRGRVITTGQTLRRWYADTEVPA